MLRYLFRHHPWESSAGVLGNQLYYAMIAVALLVGGASIYLRLVELGADRKRARGVALFCVLSSYPLGIISSRAVKLFYIPRAEWSFARWLAEATGESMHTYHAALLLPFAAWALYIRHTKLGALRVWDVIMLSLPLGHAFGRMGCLIAGCCFGEQVDWHLGPWHYDFNNPVPMYEIAGNLALYSLLLRVYRRTHFGATPRRYDGLLLALYLLIYGAMRFLLEMIRIEPVVALGLTQAQIAMCGFMLVGGAVLIRVLRRSHAEHELAQPARS